MWFGWGGSGVGRSGQRRAVSSSPSRRGPVAQLGARLNGIQEVRGSNPLGSTIDSELRIVRNAFHDRTSR
jgi:hypothetical protein